MSESRIETATIVFTDLVGSTALRSAHGDRDADLLRQQHDTMVADGITAFGGRIVKNLGDGFMAIFASSSDAVRASVAVQQAFDRHNSSAETPMFVRVGVAAGDVQVENDDCFGMPVVQAARLCDKCESGEIKATTIIKLLAGSRAEATFVELGPLELKGINEPIDSVLIEWPREDHTAEPIPLHGFLEGVRRGYLRGRSTESAALDEAWALAVAGTPQIALVSGEPGLGKTRLVTQFALEAMEKGAVVLAGRVEEGLGGPYQPFVEALMHYVRHTDEANIRLGESPGELTRIAPDLERVVGGLPEPIRADAGAEQYRLASALTSWIASVADSAPVVLVLDDFHWAEPQTALLLRHICTELGSARVIVAVTYRDTDLPDNPDAGGIISDLFRLQGTRRLDLNGLDAEAVGLLLDDAGIDAPQMAQTICDHTDGNAFFIHEIIAGLLESGVPSGASMPPLPAGIAEVVHRRLGRLNQAAVDTLHHASVIGRHFRLKLLMDVAGDELPVFDALEDAIVANIIEERGIGEYRFVHQIVVDTLLADLSATKRAQLHLNVAAAIERSWATDLDAVVGDLAHHYLSAIPLGDLDRAARIITRAGRKAARQLAFAEAIEFFTRARELADELSQGDHVELLIDLANAQSHAGVDATEATTAATDLARTLEDPALFARSVLAAERPILGVFGAVDTGRTALHEEAIRIGDSTPTDLRARLHANLGAELVFSTDTAHRERIANHALELARQAGDPETLARVLALRYPTLWNARTLGERLEIVAELDHLAQDLDDVFLRFLATGNGALAMMEDGDLVNAQERLDTLDELAEQVGEPRLRWFAAVVRAKLLVIVGSLAEADATATLALELGEQARRPDARSYFAAQSFCIGFHRRDVGGLVDMINGAVAANPDVPAFKSLRTSLNAELGNFDAVDTELDELAALNFEFPADFTQLAALCFCAHAAVTTQNVRIAELLYPVLETHRGRFSDAGSTWYGSVNHHLGGLALLLCREDATELLLAGRDQHERIGSGPMLERSDELLAEAAGSS